MYSDMISYMPVLDDHLTITTFCLGDDMNALTF